jgi:serine/threonine-protein kinase
VGGSEQRSPGSPPATTGNDGGGTPSGADAPPGPLSALLEELARTSGDGLLAAWSEEVHAGDRIGRFRVLRELGRGGFGAVYEAEDSELGRHVALKALRPGRTGRELSAEWVKREAEAVARLDHPCIVTLFDVGLSDGNPYLVMELLRGETLARRLERGALPPGEAIRIAQEVARGLAHAHARGILHRDLKPGNVYLCDDGRVKLLDFGLAHLLGAGDRAGAGTPGYMAPEQARGEEVDARADVYSAAVTLRESLTGRRVTGAGDAVPNPLARPIADATAPDRDRRPRDGTAWLEGLSAALRSLERPRRLARVALAGLVVLALAGAAAFLAWRHGRGSAVPGEGTGASIAVLPFADLSPGHDQEYLADGVAEEVLNGLAQVDGLRVIGRSTAFSYKGKGKKVEEVGRDLGVAAVLEGSVRKAGDKVRVSAQLVRTRDAATLWSHAFERNLSDVFALQDEIGRAVVEALAVRLVPGRTLARAGGTTNAEAIQLYLQGRDLLRRGATDSPRALQAFETAVRIDPGFALAWVGVADAVVTVEAVAADPPGDAGARRRRARLAADEAVRLAPGLADAYRARADVRQWLDADWSGQREDLERARALAPGDPAVALSGGWYLLAVGRAAEAAAEFERVTRDDPLLERGWVNGWLGLGSTAYSRKEHEKARAAVRRGMEVFPGYRAFFLSLLAFDRIVAGEAGDALGMVPDFRATPPFGPTWVPMVEALALHDLGRASDAVRARDEFVRIAAAWGPFQVAEVFAWQGDADGAFAWLEKARALPDTAMFWLKTDPLLQKIRGDPRWPALLERAGLPPDGTAVGAGPHGVGGGTPASTGAAAVPAPPASVAVLAFADMSTEHDQEYLADGVAEEILNVLGRVQGLKVIGRTSSFSFKGKSDDVRAIGQKLGVANVLEGSVRKDGGKVRITAKLVSAADGVQLWSESYDRKLTGIFQIQDEIARAVATAMEVKLLPSARTSPRTHDPEAYAAYLLGRQVLSRMVGGELPRAVAAFEKAIAIEPGFAEAWAGLSHAFNEQAGWQASLEGILGTKRKALEAAGRAVELAPGSGAGYAARADLVDIRGWDWTGSVADARKAVELDPGDVQARIVLGMLLAETGSGESALQHLRRATELDPLSTVAWNMLGLGAGLSGNIELRTSAMARAREINPRNDWRTITWERGTKEWAEAVLREPVEPLDAVIRGDRVLALRVLGREADARKALDELIACCSLTGAWQIAFVFEQAGDLARAFEWLERARVNLDGGIRNLKMSRRFRGDPRTAEILRKMNLTPP